MPLVEFLWGTRIQPSHKSPELLVGHFRGIVCRGMTYMEFLEKKIGEGGSVNGSAMGVA